MRPYEETSGSADALTMTAREMVECWHVLELSLRAGCQSQM